MMIPSDRLARLYRKALIKHAFLKFECTECRKPVLARVFELHCSREHGFDPSTGCVWCKTEKNWPEINYKHLNVCFKKFVKRLDFSSTSEKNNGGNNNSSSGSSSISKFRIQVSHSRCIASLAVGADGFTLFDGRTSVTYDGSLDHSKLVREVSSMGVGLLYAADDRSLAKWKDVAQCYSSTLSEIDVVEIPPDDDDDYSRRRRRCCDYCGSKNCHRWKAVECLSRALNYSFGHAEHGPKRIGEENG